MVRFRTFRNYAVMYGLEEQDEGFLISIEKSGEEGVERSAYKVFGSENELTYLLIRLWRRGVTPMSLRYILEDEGYIPQEEETPELQPAVNVFRSLKHRVPPSESEPDSEDDDPQAASHEPED